MLFAADIQLGTCKNIIFATSKNKNLTLHTSVKKGFTDIYYTYFVINGYICSSLTLIKDEDIIIKIISFTNFNAQFFIH